MYQNFYKIQKGKHIYVMFELEKIHLGDRVKCFRTHLDLLYLLSNTDSNQLKHNRPFIVELLYVWNNYNWFYQYIAHSCRFCTDVKISKSFMLNVFQFFIINFIFFPDYRLDILLLYTLSTVSFFVAVWQVILKRW